MIITNLFGYFKDALSRITMVFDSQQVYPFIDCTCLLVDWVYKVTYNSSNWVLIGNLPSKLIPRYRIDRDISWKPTNPFIDIILVHHWVNSSAWKLAISIKKYWLTSWVQPSCYERCFIIWKNLSYREGTSFHSMKDKNKVP